MQIDPDNYGVGIKCCENCGIKYDTGKARCNYLQALLCDECYYKGTIPMTWPAHWRGWTWYDENGDKHVEPAQVGCSLCHMEFNIRDPLFHDRIQRHEAKHKPRHSLKTGNPIKVNTIIGEVEWYTI